jgi:hypothetical protein
MSVSASGIVLAFAGRGWECVILRPFNHSDRGPGWRSQGSELSVGVVRVLRVNVWQHANAVRAGFEQAGSHGGGHTEGGDMAYYAKTWHGWERAVIVMVEGHRHTKFSGSWWRLCQVGHLIKVQSLDGEAGNGKGGSVAAGVPWSNPVELPWRGRCFGSILCDGRKQVGHCVF